MDDLMTDEERGSGRKKTVGLSMLALGAIAAGGQGYRRHRAADSSGEWARKGLVIVLVLAALTALGVIGARRRRAGVLDEIDMEDAVVASDNQVEPIAAAKSAASGS
jgi:hypothetical protein